MIDIYLDVAGQELSVRNAPEKLIAGTRGVLRLNFNFAPDWYGWKAAVDFGSTAVPIVHGNCIVPDSVTDSTRMAFRVVGGKDRARNVTNKVSINQKVEV